jgi:hypothetical protein
MAKTMIVTALWLAFFVLTICTVFSSYEPAAAISSLHAPPFRLLVFAGAILNAFATLSLFWGRTDAGVRAIRIFVIGATFIFWMGVYAAVIFFVLSLAGSLSRVA